MIMDFADILGTTKIPNLKENIGGAFLKLTPEEIGEISAAVPRHEVAGDRMSKNNDQSGFVDTPSLASYVASMY